LNLKAKFEAVHHIIVSSTCFYALSTWVSSVQAAPPYRVGAQHRLLLPELFQLRVALLAHGVYLVVAAQVEFESKP
jgi:hypothetical protein